MSASFPSRRGLRVKLVLPCHFHVSSISSDNPRLRASPPPKCPPNGSSQRCSYYIKWFYRDFGVAVFEAPPLKVNHLRVCVIVLSCTRVCYHRWCRNVYCGVCCVLWLCVFHLWKCTNTLTYIRLNTLIKQLKVWSDAGPLHKGTRCECRYGTRKERERERDACTLLHLFHCLHFFHWTFTEPCAV